jgi:hypothetical protein
VVVAVQTQRGADELVGVVVAGEAHQQPAVGAAVAVTSGVAGFWPALADPFVGAGVAFDDPGVHRAERGCGEGGEHGRVGGDGFGDAFAPDEQASDDLVGVALVAA